MRQLAEFLDAGGTFQIEDPERLKLPQLSDVTSLMFKSVAADYSERPPEQINYYIKHARQVLLHANAAAGGPFLFDRQSFYNRRLVMAKLDGELRGVLAADDDVSSVLAGRPGQVERGARRLVGAKVLGYKRLIHWRIGQRAVDPDFYDFLGDDVEFDASELTIVDGLGMIALGLASDAQEDVRSYPHSGEREWAATLSSWGLQPMVEEGTGEPFQAKKYVFGEAPIDPVIQTTMRAPTDVEALNAIYKKTDADRILAIARARIEE